MTIDTRGHPLLRVLKYIENNYQYLTWGDAIYKTSLSPDVPGYQEYVKTHSNTPRHQTQFSNTSFAVAAGVMPPKIQSLRRGRINAEDLQLIWKACVAIAKDASSKNPERFVLRDGGVPLPEECLASVESLQRFGETLLSQDEPAKTQLLN